MATLYYTLLFDKMHYDLNTLNNLKIKYFVRFKDKFIFKIFKKI